MFQVVSKSNRLDEKAEGEPDIAEKPVDAKPPPTQPLKREVTPDRSVTNQRSCYILRHTVLTSLVQKVTKILII